MQFSFDCGEVLRFCPERDTLYLDHRHMFRLWDFVMRCFDGGDYAEGCG